MKAYLCTRYGPPEVLQLQDIPTPLPRPHEVCIRIQATTVSSADCRVRAMNLPKGFGALGPLALGFGKPRQAILGTELVGVIESVGQAVKRFAPGQSVVAFTGAKMGTYAEYLCLAENALIAPRPEGLSLAQAAALGFGGTTALDFLRRADLRAGQHILINGASGSVGSAAVQLALHAKAEVTAVCSPVHFEGLNALGVTQLIDYHTQDFCARSASYDVVFDTAGTASWERCQPILKPHARLVLIQATLGEMLMAPYLNWRHAQRVLVGPAAERQADYQQLADLAQSGYFKPVIDREFAFSDLPAAHHYVDQGHKFGNVVVML